MSTRSVAPMHALQVPPLAVVAHELRTPLGGILGCADLLAGTSLDAEQRAHLDALREAALALAEFAEDALMWAQRADPAVSGTRCVAPADPRALLDGVVRTLGATAAWRHLELTADVRPEVPAEVLIDAAALRRVLLNLGSNALQATHRGRVTLHASYDADGTLVCAVSDTGRGMTPEQRARLFRAWATHGVERGVGLGLVLSAALVSQMDGDLSVESTPGRGSRFTVRVPLPAVLPGVS